MSVFSFGVRAVKGGIARSQLSQFIAYTTLFAPLIVTVLGVLSSAREQRLTVGLLAVCSLMYLLSMVGITVGLHRLFAHRSFRAARSLRLFLGIAGSLAAQGPLLYWVAVHRKHHQHAEEPELDPHTPYEYGRNLGALAKGVFHAHLGWMLSPPLVEFRKYCPDLLRDRDARLIHRFYGVWVAIGILLPGTVLALAGSGDWRLFVDGCLWGGVVRILLGHHATWAVNSLGHTLGYRTFPTNDDSTNNPLVALFTLGEGWHNNHHACPTSARQGLAWYEIDVGFLIIRTFAAVGLARDVRTTSKESDE
jgi:stearoyl-CoA desaturase (delta-9 desaturase)